MGKRAILYARVSTDEQAEKGYSLPTQLEAMREYAQRNGFEIAAEFCEDYSGAKIDRPELDKIRAMLDYKEAEVVIVYTSDRLSRNLAHALILREEWKQAGIELHTVSRGRSEDTAEARLTDNIESVIAEYEREKIRERTRRGKIAKARAGKWVGSSHPPYGYHRSEVQQGSGLEIDEAEAAVVRHIFELYTGVNGERLSLLGIPHRLMEEGVPSPNRSRVGLGWYSTTVKRIIRNPAYIGEFYYAHKSVSIRLPELAIIDAELWEAAQKQTEINRKLAQRNNKKHSYLLRGYLKCTCGLAMQGVPARPKGGKLYLYYACGRFRGDKQIHTCKESHLPQPKADVLVWDWVYGLLDDDAKLAKGIELARQHNTEKGKPRRTRLAIVIDLIAKAERRIKRLGDDYEKAVAEGNESAAEDYHIRHKRAFKERNDLSAEQNKLIAELTEVEFTSEHVIAIQLVVRAIRARLGKATFEQKREVLDLLKFSGQIGYQDRQRGLWCTCTFTLDPKFLALESHSSR